MSREAPTLNELYGPGASNADDDVDFDDEPSDGDCFHCGGEGWIDGYDEDPLWFNPGELERCASCGGSGRAKDMTIW